jgi:ABC-type Zn uptake system ZnuABC Zn-binding protein ZnuA
MGGDEVAVTVFAKGPEDPHFVEARPSFVKALSKSDLFVQNGLDLELGWAPTLLRNARNPDLLPGAPRFVDVSRAIAPLEVPTAAVDRSMGDVHPLGNPHFLLDPLNGLAVAGALRDKLAELRPERGAYFTERYEAFRARLGAALVGRELAARYDATKLARLHEGGKLGAFLGEQGQSSLLGGWLGAMAPHFGVKAVADHNLWPYFSRRFGVRTIGFLEPKPGVPPTTKHLGALVERMRAEGVVLILASAYYDPRHAEFVAGQTGARVARMANQVGSREGTGDYLAMIDANVRQIVSALGEGR